MIQFTEDEIKAMLRNLGEIPAKFSIELIKFLEMKLLEKNKEQQCS